MKNLVLITTALILGSCGNNSKKEDEERVRMDKVERIEAAAIAKKKLNEMDFIYDKRNDCYHDFWGSDYCILVVANDRKIDYNPIKFTIHMMGLISMSATTVLIPQSLLLL